MSRCQSLYRSDSVIMSFKNKVVLITGASSGIGAACAKKFAKSAALLCLIGRNLENLEQIAMQCVEISSHTPLTIIADITSEGEVERIVNLTINKYGKIDILINNAGILSTFGLQAGIEDYDKIMTTNVRAPYLLTQKTIPHLINTKGNIINISSILSFKPQTIMTSYCMSKAATDMFTKCLALELGTNGVRVNAVNPGPVQTEIFKRSGMSDDNVGNMFGEVKINTPLKKITTADDVAELVIFLSSDKACCVTGCCYIIDCGLSLNLVENSNKKH